MQYLLGTAPAKAPAKPSCRYFALDAAQQYTFRWRQVRNPAPPDADQLQHTRPFDNYRNILSNQRPPFPKKLLLDLLRSSGQERLGGLSPQRQTWKPGKGSKRPRKSCRFGCGGSTPTLTTNTGFCLQCDRADLTTAMSVMASSHTHLSISGEWPSGSRSSKSPSLLPFARTNREHTVKKRHACRKGSIDGPEQNTGAWTCAVCTTAFSSSPIQPFFMSLGVVIVGMYAKRNPARPF